ncbi:MAG: helix-turn-helix domain-containing protein [Elusimicrobia bacterium]|nr:helix-turn-helix domain-containing protein [Elusimicrobiota bacterium]
MNNNIYRVLGRAVKNFRLGLGWSQEELGERADLHPSYIGQIERGTKKFSLLTLQKLSAALKVETTNLLQDKPFKYKPSSWEQKIIGIIRDRPAELQKFTYRIVKEALRAHTRRNKP